MPSFSIYAAVYGKTWKQKLLKEKAASSKEDSKAKAHGNDISDENDAVVSVGLRDLTRRDIAVHRDLARAMSGRGLWKSTVDPKSGETYWYNQITSEVSWNAPPDKLQYNAPRRIILRSSSSTVSSSSSSSSSSSAAASDTGEWKKAIDPTAGRPYWYNKKTRETSWTCPPDSLKSGNDAVPSTVGGLGLGCGALSLGAMGCQDACRDAAVLLDDINCVDNDTDVDGSVRDDELDDNSIFAHYAVDELPSRALKNYSSIEDIAGCIDVLRELR